MALNNQLAMLRQLNLSISTNLLAELTGINRNRLSSYFAGTTQLPGREAERLNWTFDSLDLIVRAAQPFPVLFKDTAMVKDLINRVRAGEFEGKGE